MPKSLADFPRPPQDNGRGLHGSAATGWSGGAEGHDFWIDELCALGVKWFKVLDDGGDSLVLCQRLIAAGIFPVVRLIRKDPPPNDSFEPNPGHLNPREEEIVKSLIAGGVRYFETNNEPNLGVEWKLGAMPADPLEAAKLVALNWLFDARFILEAGGFPGLPAVSIGGSMDLIGALVSLGRQDILLEGCWIALHNYCLNHPLNYPDDPVNRTGMGLQPGEYDFGPLTQWIWTNLDAGHVDTLEQINALRVSKKNPTQTINDDHSGFREFEYYNNLAVKYLGRSIPILTTEGGYWIGRREDPRYPRITPEMQRDLTVAMFDYLQRRAPDYYFAMLPWLMLPSAIWESDAWYGNFWEKTFRKGYHGGGAIPRLAVPEYSPGQPLPVITGVKAMPKLARLLPGVQPAPPPPIVVQPPPQPRPVEPPAPAPTPVPPVTIPPITRIPTPVPGGENFYIIQPGDTLGKIAARFGTTVAALIAANNITSPNLIRAGARLILPPPVTAPAPEPVTPAPILRPAPEPIVPAPAPKPAPEPVPPAPILQPAPEPVPPAPILQPAPEPVIPAPTPKPPPELVTPAPTPKPAPEPIFPPPGPAPSPTPVPRIPTPAPTTIYVIEPGDTLGKIATRFGTTIAAIIATNRIVNPNLIRAGTKLMIPVAPPEVPPTMPEEMPIMPTPPAPRPPAPPPPPPGPRGVQVDPRLNALGVRVESADVAPGQVYWKLIRAVYQDPDESGGNHNVFYKVVDENNHPIANHKVLQAWPSDQTDATTKPDGTCDIALWASFAPDRGERGPYSAWVDGAPSDKVTGMGLPLSRNVNFLLTWQRAKK